jgi:hypothetical protein
VLFALLAWFAFFNDSASTLRLRAVWTLNEAPDQRLAMYIVISNPKRRSVNSGLLQAMINLLISFFGGRSDCTDQRIATSVRSL